MASRVLMLALLLLVVVASAKRHVGDAPLGFDDSYAISWGRDHVSSLYNGTVIQLSMDNYTGSGFYSKIRYGSGFFHMKIMLPGGDSAGVVTAFYLSSDTNNHDELDFEFLGQRRGNPYVVQTNIFANGHGNREQRFRLWFDPTADFHDYEILWNPYQIVFFIDQSPIRVYKNKRNVVYPLQPMKVLASLWDGDNWASDGGKSKIDWRQAPFKAQFQGFDIDGCPLKGGGRYRQACSSSRLWWNTGRYSGLSHAQQEEYERVKKKYMTYDYCSDKSRNHRPPPECF